MKYTRDSSRQWYNNLPGKRASAAMVIRWGDKYLMLKDDYKDYMTFPSGVVDPDESPLATAIRETNEESGLVFDPQDVSFYSVCYINEYDGFKDRFHFYFLTEVNDDIDAKIKIGEGIEYYKWVGVDEIAELAVQQRVYVHLQKLLMSPGSPEPYFEV
ncbi:MAG: hypothetical protein JWO07_302 [Candidatus Saccharibacteria bacterium]|nr:hypothetical protein [Candidatus Saccharibacteria bacterium]